MKTWSRLCVFVWPYRRKLILSVAFGLFAAFLWSVELLLTFPITIMFGEHQTLSRYVEHETSVAIEAIAVRKANISHMDEALTRLPENGDRRRYSERVSVMRGLRTRISSGC